MSRSLATVSIVWLRDELFSFSPSLLTCIHSTGLEQRRKRFFPLPAGQLFNGHQSHVRFLDVHMSLSTHTHTLDRKRVALLHAFRSNALSWFVKCFQCWSLGLIPRKCSLHCFAWPLLKFTNWQCSPFWLLEISWPIGESLTLVVTQR